MKNLILKDIRVLGAYNIFFALLAFISGATGAVNFVQSNTVYIFMSFISIYFIIMNLILTDIENNTEPLIHSMPIKKSDVVKSRYLSILLYISFILGLIFFSSNIGTILSTRAVGRPFDFVLLLLIESLVVLYFSIVIPFHYYDNKKTKIFDLLFYTSLIFLPGTVKRLGINSDNNTIQQILNLNFNILAPIVLIISLVFYTISLFVSNTIYSKKEF